MERSVFGGPVYLVEEKKKELNRALRNLYYGDCTMGEKKESFDLLMKFINKDNVEGRIR